MTAAREPPAKYRQRVKGEALAELRSMGDDIWNVLSAYDARVNSSGVEGIGGVGTSPAVMRSAAREAHSRWRLSSDPADLWVLAALDAFVAACDVGGRTGGFAKGVRAAARAQVNELMKARAVELGTWEPPPRTWKPVRKAED